MDQLHFYQLQLNYNYIRFNQLQLTTTNNQASYNHFNYKVASLNGIVQRHSVESRWSCLRSSFENSEDVRN